MKLTRSDDTMKHFAHMMVTIMVYEERDGRAHEWNGTGFVIVVSDKWFLVTAGHVVADLIAAESAGRLLRVFICDAWTNEYGRGHAFPLARDVSRWIVVGDADTLDLGAIDLGENYKSILEAGKLQAVPEEDWRNAPQQFDLYYLLGTPHEIVTSDGSEYRLPTGFDVPKGLMRVERIARPDWARETPHERFYGKLVRSEDGDVTIKSIGGVSGGPLLGWVKVKGGFKCWVFAVQSGWFEKHKIIVGDFLPALGEALTMRLLTSPA